MIALNLKEQLELAKEGKEDSLISLTGVHKTVRVSWNSLSNYDSAGLTEPEHFHTIKIKMGDFVSIATKCQFFLSGTHNYKRVTTYLPSFDRSAPMKDNLLSKGDIVIGNDVWIAQGATILSGVTISDGAVIGANSVVTKDVEPYTIVAGNPARPISKRFDDQTIEDLLRIKWWNLPMEELEKKKDLIFSTDIEAFIRSFD